MDFQLNDEQQFLRQTVREFAERELAPKAKEVDENARIPDSTWQRMAEAADMIFVEPVQNDLAAHP